MRYLLDTNIVSHLMRFPQGPVASSIALARESAVFTSVVVVAELRYGIAKKGSRTLADRLEAILAGLAVVPLEQPADAEYGRLRAWLETAGTPIGANDLLIAAQALALGCTLVTDNERELSRIPKLMLENWIRRPEPLK